MQKQKSKPGWQASFERGIKIIAEFAELLKHHDELAKAFARRLFTIAAYVLPEEWLGDQLERWFHQSANWIKTLVTVGRIFLLVIPLIRIKLQDILSPKLEEPLLALINTITVPDIYLNPANHVLKNFRLSIIENEKICAQLHAFSSSMAAKDPSEYSNADLSVAKMVFANTFARLKKRDKAIGAAGRDANTLRDRIMPLTSHAQREKINLLVLVTVLSNSINQSAKRSDEFSTEIKHIIEDLGRRWPALNEMEFPEYPLFYLIF